MNFLATMRIQLARKFGNPSWKRVVLQCQVDRIDKAYAINHPSDQP
jgi:hypothetical protein